MGSHFAQNTTPNHCSLLRRHTPLSRICTDTKHPQLQPKPPLFLAWTWMWAKCATVWATGTPSEQYVRKVDKKILEVGQKKYSKLAFEQFGSYSPIFIDSTESTQLLLMNFASTSRRPLLGYLCGWSIEAASLHFLLQKCMSLQVVALNCNSERPQHIHTPGQWSGAYLTKLWPLFRLKVATNLEAWARQIALGRLWDRRQSPRARADRRRWWGLPRLSCCRCVGGLAAVLVVRLHVAGNAGALSVARPPLPAKPPARRCKGARGSISPCVRVTFYPARSPVFRRPPEARRSSVNFFAVGAVPG